MPTIPNFSNIGGDLQAAGGVLGGLGALIGGQATAAGDQAAAQGYATESSLYSAAAGIAGENQTIEQWNTRLQQYISMRALRQTQASVEAGTTGAGGGVGFQLSGSEQYIIQQNAMMGGLASAIIGEQGAIQENAYALQQTTLQGEAAQATAASAAARQAASAAGTQGFLGLLGGIAGGVAKLFP